MVTKLPIPSEADWGNYQSDQDQQYVYKMFFGKNFEQVIPRFERNAIEACDELRFIAAVPFRYYLLAFASYMLSDLVLKNRMASDAASCFIGLVHEKLLSARDDIAPIIIDLIPAIEFVANNQSLFDADIDIYGNFKDKLDDIKRIVMCGED